MSVSYEVGILVGSLRKESLSRKLAKALTKLAPDSLKFRFIEIGDLPFYNDDVEAAGVPASWARLRGEVKAVDALLFITPEYNRSIPAALKNALDVASRPYGQGAWDGKPGAVVSLSPGGLGGFGANHHLRQILVCLNVPVMAQPEAYVGGAMQLFDAAGDIANEGTRGFLTKFMQAFAAWTAANAKR